MRFKQHIRLTILAMATSYVLYLAYQNQLNLYIHPRYIVFTTILSVLGLLLTLLDSYYTRPEVKDHAHSHSRILYVPLFLLLAMALLLPARTLTSSTVSQRLTDSGSLVATTESQQTVSNFSGSSKGLRIVDWARIISTNTDPAFYINKPAKISGFIFDAELGADAVWVARFTLSCCAVDAQPVGVPVEISDWSTEFNENAWIEVEGQFKMSTTDKGDQLILVPDTVTKIEQPENPYAN
jgi:uncharacterized repeat protein (TIGR03943 family)